MTSTEMINYINKKLKQISPTGCLSITGEKFIEERMKKSESEGGFSEYWKNISLEDVSG